MNALSAACTSPHVAFLFQLYKDRYRSSQPKKGEFLLARPCNCNPSQKLTTLFLFQIVQLGGISLILAEFATLKAPAKALNDWIAMLTG